MYEGLLKQYKEYLPITDNTPMISLAEGNTPLIPLHSLSKELGINLYGKYEGLNPTGSFKDRGMVMAVAKAVEEGAKAIVCASTGNTSAKNTLMLQEQVLKPMWLFQMAKLQWANSRKQLFMVQISSRFQAILMKR